MIKQLAEVMHEAYTTQTISDHKFVLYPIYDGISFEAAIHPSNGRIMAVRCSEPKYHDVEHFILGQLTEGPIDRNDKSIFKDNNTVRGVLVTKYPHKEEFNLKKFHAQIEEGDVLGMSSYKAIITGATDAALTSMHMTPSKFIEVMIRNEMSIHNAVVFGFNNILLELVINGYRRIVDDLPVTILGVDVIIETFRPAGKLISNNARYSVYF